ncbi:hypothetical protein [Alloscardovia omnicolens]
MRATYKTDTINSVTINADDYRRFTQGSKKFLVFDDDMFGEPSSLILFTDEDTQKPLGLVIVNSCGSLQIEDDEKPLIGTVRLLEHIMQTSTKGVMQNLKIKDSSWFYIYSLDTVIADAGDPDTAAVLYKLQVSHKRNWDD